MMNSSLVLYALMLLVVVLGVGRYKGARALIGKLGITKIDLRKELATAFVYLCILFITSVAIGAVMSSLGFAEDLQQVTNVLKGVDLPSLLIVLTTASFVEEVFFRGYLQRKTNIIFASFIFSYFHIIYGSLSEMIGTFFLGLILGHEYKKTNNLFAPILSHYFYNLLIIILMFA